MFLISLICTNTDGVACGLGTQIYFIFFRNTREKKMEHVWSSKSKKFTQYSVCMYKATSKGNSYEVALRWENTAIMLLLRENMA